MSIRNIVSTLLYNAYDCSREILADPRCGLSASISCPERDAFVAGGGGPSDMVANSESASRDSSSSFVRVFLNPSSQHSHSNQNILQSASPLTPTGIRSQITSGERMATPMEGVEEPEWKKLKLSLERPYKDDNGEPIPVLLDIAPDGQQIFEP